METPLVTSGCPQIYTRLGSSQFLIYCSPASNALTAERKASSRWDEESQAYILIRKIKKKQPCSLVLAGLVRCWDGLPGEATGSAAGETFRK